MNRYRFKTKDEFIRDGQWYDEYDCPVGWAEGGDMNHYLGQDVPEGANENCDLREDFIHDGWYFRATNYVLKEEDYTGRWIKALINDPQFTGVRLGEVIKIISKPNSYKLDRTPSGCTGMSIRYPLNTSEWELVEEPKEESKLASFPSSKQGYDAQFTNEQDPLYICKQEYRKGMKVRSACKKGIYAGEFIITVNPEEFRITNSGVDYSHSKGFLYMNGKYAEILEEDGKVEQLPIYTDTSCKKEVLSFKTENKPSIEPVHSISVNLRTKKQINKFKF